MGCYISINRCAMCSRIEQRSLKLLKRIRQFVPWQNPYLYKPDDFENGGFPFEAYVIPQAIRTEAKEDGNASSWHVGGSLLRLRPCPHRYFPRRPNRSGRSHLSWSREDLWTSQFPKSPYRPYHSEWNPIANSCWEHWKIWHSFLCFQRTWWCHGQHCCVFTTSN